MSRFLFDENIPASAARATRDLGYEVALVSEIAPGASDKDILALATRERMVIVTFDKDFGELAFHVAARKPTGIVLLRMGMGGAQDVAQRIANLLSARDDWEGRFSVVTTGRVRMRRLPDDLA